MKWFDALRYQLRVDVNFLNLKKSKSWFWLNGSKSGNQTVCVCVAQSCVLEQSASEMFLLIKWFKGKKKRSKIEFLFRWFVDH